MGVETEVLRSWLTQSAPERSTGGSLRRDLSPFSFPLQWKKKTRTEEAEPFAQSLVDNLVRGRIICR